MPSAPSIAHTVASYPRWYRKRYCSLSSLREVAKYPSPPVDSRHFTPGQSLFGGWARSGDDSLRIGRRMADGRQTVWGVGVRSERSVVWNALGFANCDSVCNTVC